MITVLHGEVYPNEYNVTWGPGGRGPSPPQGAVIRNALTKPHRSLFGAKEIEVVMMVVSVLELSVVIGVALEKVERVEKVVKVEKVEKVEGNIDSGRLLAGTVFY